ncbi:histidine kinase [Dyadobacter chenwenxiniae]|uniref:Histidine kinase n=1 Tax=Dyadobacter chenwenxiniae TaxID=2906456 RepID=A0A9X1TDC9_9BACT|nr:histidine kinase [Dyadobacter chenwenxiniae]MCF0060549.1 histidine kinase [Dyadobacter chenwenxiniae]UON86280.1 histidine kinase [Dyadobacter chenwenxiniae]
MRPYIFGRKWLLGFALAIVYIPLRTFINVQQDFWNTILTKLPFFCIEILISTIFYTAWIYLIDWFLQKLALVTGSDRSSEFKITDQLMTLLPAVVLALLFNIMLIYTWGFMNSFWTHMPSPTFHGAYRSEIGMVKWRANEALTILALLAGYYLCLSNQVQEKLKRLLVDSEKLAKENMAARFQALKNQISPHFLFNNLSVLASLVESQPEKSGEFIQQLSLAYRYILSQAELHQISLKEEIKFLETYTFLLRTRFKEKVRIEVSLAPGDLERFSIIPLTLQPLIENAVKHNTMSAINPLTIRIFIQDDMLVVCNLLQARKLNASSTKLGLQNIESRYRLLQNKEVIVEKTDAHFIVKIPLLS